MTLNTRRFLYIFFILAFLTITPVLFMYAAGYKIGSNFKFEKTGILIIDTKPQNAKIYLNGKLQQNFFKKLVSEDEGPLTTPIKLKGLAPGEYNVRLELNNYWPWEKKLEIKSGQSTYIEDVNLFKINQPLLLESGQHQQLSLSPDNKYLITDNEQGASRIKLSDSTTMTQSASSAQDKSASTAITWSADGQKTIINNQLFFLNDWNEPVALEQLIGDHISDLKWNTHEDHKLYYTSNGSIFHFDLKRNVSKNILSDQTFSDYLPKNNHLYYVSTKDNETSLHVVNLNDSTEVGKTSLPHSDYRFLNPSNRLINLYDRTHQILYLIDPLSNIKPLRETLTNVKTAKWIGNNRLLYASDFEIWLLDANSSNRTLITRVSQEIEDIFWLPNNNYIVYATNKQINAIELDDRDKYNVTRIIELDTIQSPLLNKKGDTLFFQSRIGNQEGVYKLPIQ